MKRFLRICLMLLVALLTGCEREPLYLPGNTAVLGITLEMPASTLVKATVPASEEENAIHDLKIWVFHSTTHELVTSLELDSTSDADDFPQPGSVKRYALPVSWDFALERPRPSVDVYVLANSAAITLSQPLWAQRTQEHEVSSWAQVEAAYFGGADFAPSAKVDAVPLTGLPMSGKATGLVISGEEPSLSVATVSLERCVSKIRFLFCQMKTVGDAQDLETFRVDRIVLSGNSIATKENLFTEEAPSVGAEYLTAGSDDVEFLEDPLYVADSDKPEYYAYAGQDGPTYERIIREGLDDTPPKEPEITHAGTYYLRESGRPLTGTIYYTVIKGAGTEQEEIRTGLTKTFTMADSEVLARNHTWTVYGYYVSKRSLQLSVSVLPWDKSDYSIDFSMESLMVTWKLSVLNQTVSSVDPILGKDNHYTVTLKNNSPASAYLYVAAPHSGVLQLSVYSENGTQNAFDVWFTDEPTRKSRETSINPDKNNGRIDISIDRTQDESYTGSFSNAVITLGFKAFTQDREREIDGASECIDQVYHFTLP